MVCRSPEPPTDEHLCFPTVRTTSVILASLAPVCQRTVDLSQRRLPMRGVVMQLTSGDISTSEGGANLDSWRRAKIRRHRQ